MNSIDLPGRIRTVLDLLRAEDFNHQVVLIGELRRELEKIRPRFASVESLAEWIRMESRQLSRFPNATDKEIDDALEGEERCIHQLRADRDFHDTAASVGPVVMVD
jgi:hypothetical protein